MEDHLYDSNYDELVENGDEVWGDATKQHQEMLIALNKGEVKQFPTTCVGAMRFLDDEGPDELNREIRKECVRDGMTVKTLSSEGENIELDATYE